MAGVEVKCRDVSDKLLMHYRHWMEDEGLQSRTASERLRLIRSVVRHWDPAKFPISDIHPVLQLVDADVKGTLEQIFVQEYLPQRTRITSDQTVRQYKRCLLLFGRFLEHPARPADLNDRTVGRFLRWLVSDGEIKAIKAVSANGYVKQLLAIWTWLAKQRVVEKFPTVESLPEPKPIPLSYSARQLVQLFEACKSIEGYIGPHHLACDVWPAFHLVLWDTGERTGAMLQLRWDWLEWETGYLCVPGEFRKGRQKPMVYRLKEATLNALRVIESPPRALIFNMFPSFRFYPTYRKLIKFSGLEYIPRKTTPQMMRRTFASFIEAAGGNATKALKHTDRRVTEDSYLDPRICETIQENEKLFALTN
jgi:integrase